MVLHQGDFDYSDNPDLWMKQIDNILGSSFPYFASVGNHDVSVWKEYQNKLVSRLDNINGATCTGDYGVNSACTYKDIFFVLSGIGTVGTDHVNFLRNALNDTDKVWKICSWHKNQRLIQVGGNVDAVGWGAYEACRQAGAIITTGHSHTYSRTHLMSSFKFQTVASTSNNLILTEGKSFSFVSGLGGESIRATRNNSGNNPWWASVYSRDENANFGALFCSFGVNGDENEAECYFKNIDGLIVDSFTISYQ